MQKVTVKTVSGIIFEGPLVEKSEGKWECSFPDLKFTGSKRDVLDKIIMHFVDCSISVCTIVKERGEEK